MEPPQLPDGEPTISVGAVLHGESLRSQPPAEEFMCTQSPDSLTSENASAGKSVVNDISHPDKAGVQGSSVKQAENEFSPHNNTKSTPDDITKTIAKQSNIENHQSQPVAQESKGPLSPTSLTSDYASMVSSSFSEAVSEVTSHNSVLNDSTRKETRSEATTIGVTKSNLKQKPSPLTLTALTNGHISLAETIDQVPSLNKAYPSETLWKRPQLKETTLSNAHLQLNEQHPSEALLNEEVDSTENVSGTSSSSDTFHSFSSDNGTTFIQTRELDSQTFTPDLSEPLSLPKTTSSDRPMAPVSPFPSVAGNLEVRNVTVCLVICSTMSCISL